MGLSIDFAFVGWRKDLGALMIVERVQHKRWNPTKAAREANIDPGTLRRIEAGGNYEIEKLEAYATALGRPIESWLRQVLAIPDDLLDKVKRWSQGIDTGEHKASSLKDERPTRGKKQG